MRYGLHTTYARRWTPRRIRPDWTAPLSYTYGYLSVALNPMNGHLIAAFLPDMSKESYQAFLTLVKEEYAEDMILYRDQAGAHTAKDLQVPQSIALRELPAYSPELNPAERFFEELRPLLANHVFKSMEEIESSIAKILQKYWESPQLIRSLTCFPWIEEALSKGKENIT